MKRFDISFKKAKDFVYHKDYRSRMKRSVVDAYGGKCECCGIKQLDFLTIDHIRGDGQADRKGRDFYRYLIKAGFPQNGYRVLCMNCNWAMRHGKMCPHQRTKGKPYSMRHIKEIRSASYLNGDRIFPDNLKTVDNQLEEQNPQ